jgi:hypothetical protein
MEAIDAQRLIYRLPKPCPDGRTALTLAPLKLIDPLPAHPLAADQLQRPLRSRFRQRLMPGVNRGTGALFLMA